MTQEQALERAKTLLQEGRHSCAVCKEDKIYTSDDRGIRPLVLWLRADAQETAESKKILQNAAAADKVIGRAAALLFAHGGISALWADILSESAAEILREQGIPYSCGKLVPAIRNRDNTGYCPMETRAKDITSPQEAFAVFDGVVK